MLLVKVYTLTAALTLVTLLLAFGAIKLAGAHECETTCYTIGNMTQCTKVCD